MNMYLPQTNINSSYQAYNPSRTNIYSGSTPRSTSSQGSSGGMGGGIDPSQAMSMWNNYSQMFSGGGDTSLTSLFTGGSGGGAAAGSGSATGAASSGSGASSGALGGMGWWAALAAVIAGNEEEARKKGRRDEDTTSRVVDMFSGAVIEQDMDYYGDKIGGIGGEVVSTLGQLGNPEGVWTFLKDLF